MDVDYDKQIAASVDHIFEVMSARVSAVDMERIKSAYALAREAHAPQRRKSGEPYIIHPIAVATIAAEELCLDANSVMAAFLHDVVEDTPHTIEDIERMFGKDVAFLVNTVTKKKKENYKMSKQVDNYQQLLESIHYDIRALMVKIADRLHNMRTLSSMRPDKQMKIAGETDYFYAPLANRLGLFNVKTDLENLSFKYRCPLEFDDLSYALEQDLKGNEQRMKVFTDNIEQTLHKAGIEARAEVYYRKPYSIWRRMKSENKDFLHIDNRYYVRVTYTYCDKPDMSEKDVCLRIYSLLTDVFNEKAGSFVNLIDQAKENSYKCLKVMLLSNEGVWEDVQICSEEMVESSKLGCVYQAQEGNIADWITRFRMVLEDIAKQEISDGSFIEKIATTLYYDDVMVFTPQGRGIIMPKGSTVIDFAFEIDDQLGMKAKYARINGKLCSVKTELHRGDCIEVGTSDDAAPKIDWLDHCVTYKAKNALNGLFSAINDNGLCRCPTCNPLPGGDTIGFKQLDNRIMIHRRTCPDVIRDASKYGDSIVEVKFPEDETVVYPVSVNVRGIDRYHLLIDIVDGITNTLHLSIDSLTTVTKDEIVDCTITFFVHSVKELVLSMNHLYSIEGIDEVKQIEE